MTNSEELSIRDNLLYAARSHFEAKVQQAKTNLLIYIDNPVGIGEHPDIVAEVVGLVEQLAAAEEGLQALDDHFPATHGRPSARTYRREYIR